MKRKKPIMRKPMALLLCLVVAVTFTMPVVAFGEGDTGETRSFNVNLFDYDQQTILNALEEKFPGDPPQSVEPVIDVMENSLLMEGTEDPVDLLMEESQSPEHSLMKESEGLEGTVDLLMVEPQGIVDPDYSQMFMFMGGRGKDAAPDDRPWFSKWEKDHYVYQGLMKYDLNSKGRPEYTDGILGIDLFDPNESEDYDAYKNIPFEFNYDSSTEIYSYSSSKNSATFDGSGVSLGESLGGGVSVNGFRPFGSEPESVLDHFGMSMEVEFYIPKNGPAGLEFNFSGDDDVWVFVDDELVLDLGGIHGALGGIVTFEEGGALGTIQSGAEIFLYDNGNKVDGGNGSKEISGDFSPGTTHTLNFFYLERGGNASNCSIEFNIPPTTTDFTFIKAAGDTEEGLPGATFRLEGKDKEGSTIIKDAVSDEFGIVGFMGIPEGEYVLIETDAPKGYYPSDEVYLIRVVPWEPLPSFVKTKDDLFGLCVEYAREPVEPEEPVWVRLIDSEDLWFSNDPIPLAEEQVLTVKKIATGNRAPANAEYEFMIQFFKEGKEDENYYRIVDKKVGGELEVKNAAVEILNLADIVTELQVDGDYQDYYRFYLKHGQQIDFDYGSFFAQNEEEPEAFARDVAPSIPELQFRLIETDNQKAVTTTIAPTGEFGTEIPAPTIEGMKIEGSLGADSEGVVVTYTNAFGNRDKDKDKDKDKDRDKDRDKDDDPVIPEDPEPQSPATEVTVPITKVPQLPKTGGLGAVLFLGLGSLMAGAGMYLRRR